MLAAAFFAYASDSYHDLDANHRNLVSTETLPVQQGDNYLAFGDPNAAVGLVFYPGAKVEYSAYAPLMRDLAERGYLAVVVQMPFNFAFFDINAADRVRADFPDVGTWWVGGHSLGGSMAAQYAVDHAGDGTREGLVLLGSYSASDLSSTNLGAISLYGSNDQVLTAPNSRTTPTCCPREPKPWRSKAATMLASAPTARKAAMAKPASPPRNSRAKPPTPSTATSGPATPSRPWQPQHSANHTQPSRL